MARRISNVPSTRIVVHRKELDPFVSAEHIVASDEMTSVVKDAPAFVKDDVLISSNERLGVAKEHDASLSSDVIVSPDTEKKNIFQKPTNVSLDISPSSDEITQTVRREVQLSADVSTSEDTPKSLVLGKPISVSQEIQISSDERTQTVRREAQLSADVSTSEDTPKSLVLGKPIVVDTEITPSADEITVALKHADTQVSSEISVAQDTEKEIIYQRQPIVVSPELQQSQNEITSTVQREAQLSTDVSTSEDTPKIHILGKPIVVNTEIQPSRDEATSTIKQVPQLSSEIATSNDESSRYQRFQDAFAGQLLSKGDPLRIGKENFSLLQNLRYTDFGLEGVNGSSRINTEPLVLAIKNGIHFKTNYTEDSYVIVQTEYDGYQPQLWINKTDIPDAGDFYNAETVTITLGSNDTIVFRSTYDSGTHDSNWIYLTLEAGNYIATDFATHLALKMNNNVNLGKGGGTEEIIVFTVTYSSTITKKFTITTDNASYKLKYSYDNSTCDSEIGLTANVSSWTRPIISDTAIASGDSLKLETIDASLARMSPLPNGQVGICDQKNNYIWAGDEMPCAAFLVFDETTDTEGTTAPDYIKRIKDSHIEDFTKEVNNNVSSDVATIIGRKKEYGDSADTYNVTHDPNNQRVRYVTGDYNPFSEGMNVGDVVHIVAGGTMSSGNTGEWKVVTVDTSYFEVYRSDATAAGDENGMTCGGIYTYGKVIAVGATRPLQKINFTISSANTITSEIEILGWTGSQFTEYSTTDDGTASGGKTFAVPSGSISFSTDTFTDKPVFIGDRYLYFYLLRIPPDISAASENGISVSISNVIVQSNITDIANIWDGIYRKCIQCLVRRDKGSGKKPIKYTLEASMESLLSQSTQNYGVVLGDSTDLLTRQGYIELMFTEKMCGLQINMLAGNFIDATDITLRIYYNHNNSWKEATVLRDGTAYYLHTDDWRTSPIDGTLYGNGVILWQIPDNESKIKINGVQGYAYRLILNDSSNAKIDDGTTIDTIYGIPAFLNITKLYKFPFQYKNRAMLCNCISDKEYNRIDYSKVNAPDVYNGTDASGGGNERSLKFGSYEGLTAAIELFNQYGISVDSVGLMFKNTETYQLTGQSPETFKIDQVSKAIGCPAHKTLDTAEVAFQRGASPERNIAIWLSDKGPMMFYNNSILPIPGLEKYFDPADTEYIDPDYIDISAGCYDPVYREYNLLLPIPTTAGDAQATNNRWFVLDVLRMKWYEKTGETTEYFPQGLFRVEDTKGNKYIYGYDDTGYLQRIEHPNRFYWSDPDDDTKVGITNIVQSADIMLTDNIWDEVMVYFHKIIFEENDDGTITVDLFIDGNRDSDDNAVDERYTVTNTSTTGIAFVDSDPDTITDTTSSFVKEGFNDGDTIIITGTDSNGTDSESKTFTVATVAAGTLTLISSDSLTAEAVTTLNTVTIRRQALPYQSAMNETSKKNRYKSIISYIKAVGKSFKFRTTIEDCTTTKPKLFSWGLQFEFFREDLTDKADLN